MTTRVAGRTAKADGAGPSPIKTWIFDSVGNRKYAIQLAKASNGNPCFKFVEGVPQPDGTYRKFNVTVWSEDFDRLFSTLDEVRAYVKEQNIRTPAGHKFDPGKPRPKNGGPSRPPRAA